MLFVVQVARNQIHLTQSNKKNAKLQRAPGDLNSLRAILDNLDLHGKAFGHNVKSP